MRSAAYSMLNTSSALNGDRSIGPTAAPKEPVPSTPPMSKSVDNRPACAGVVMSAYGPHQHPASIIRNTFDVKRQPVHEARDVRDQLGEEEAQET